MKVIGYPQPGKAKSRALLEAFIEGAGGALIDPIGGFWEQPHAAAFYGTIGIEGFFRQATKRGPWFYLDNAFLDAARGTHYRVGVNALQGPLVAADHERLGALSAAGLEFKPWRENGRHIVICPQSDYYMRELAGYPGGAVAWTSDVMVRLAKFTDRPIRCRAWAQDKIALSRTLHEDLEGAWAVIVYSSAAAIAAVLAGVPVFVLGESPALLMGLSDLSRIEHPRRPDGRMEWAARLAASQWTVEELRSGKAWRALEQLVAAEVAP